jgi:hypothetical protein
MINSKWILRLNAMVFISIRSLAWNSPTIGIASMGLYIHLMIYGKKMRYKLFFLGGLDQLAARSRKMADSILA